MYGVSLWSLACHYPNFTDEETESQDDAQLQYCPLRPKPLSWPQSVPMACPMLSQGHHLKGQIAWFKIPEASDGLFTGVFWSTLGNVLVSSLLPF